MASNTQCKITYKDGANKICSNPECNLSNRFICEECEEAHEHGGSLSMVRINKIKQISQVLKNTVKYAQQIASLYQEIFNIVKKNAENQLNKMKNLIISCSKTNEQIQKLFEESHYQNFPKLWEGIQKKTISEEIKSLNSHYVEIVQQKVQAISYLMQEQHRMKSGVLRRRSTVDNNSQESEKNEKYSNNFIEDLMNIFKLLPSNFAIPLSDFASSSIKKELKKLQEKSKHIKEDLIISKFYEIIGDKHQFENLVNKMITKEPINRQILSKKAMLLKQHHKYKEALQIYTQLITLANKGGYEYQAYCFQRGIIQQLLGNYAGAQRDFRACLNNDMFGARMKLINIYQHQNRSEQAEEHLLHITQKNQFSKQDKVKALSLLANMATQQGKSQKAIDYYTHALKHNPQHFQNIVNRASLYHESSNHQLARKDYTDALKLKPNNAHLHYNRGVTSLSLGQKNNACFDFTKAIECDSNFKLAYLKLANLYMQVGNKQQAFHYYEKCTHFFPNNEIVWHNYSILLKAKMPNNRQKIVSALNKVLEINPNNETALLARVKELMNMQSKQKQLEADLTRLIELGIKQTSIIYNRAVIRQNLKKHDLALEDLQTILKQHPQNLLALRSKAKILYNMNNTIEYEQILNQIETIEKNEKN